MWSKKTCALLSLLGLLLGPGYGAVAGDVELDTREPMPVDNDGRRAAVDTFVSTSGCPALRLASPIYDASRCNSVTATTCAVTCRYGSTASSALGRSVPGKPSYFQCVRSTLTKKVFWRGIVPVGCRSTPLTCTGARVLCTSGVLQGLLACGLGTSYACNTNRCCLVVNTKSLKSCATFNGCTGSQVLVAKPQSVVCKNGACTAALCCRSAIEANSNSSTLLIPSADVRGVTCAAAGIQCPRNTQLAKGRSCVDAEQAVCNYLACCDPTCAGYTCTKAGQIIRDPSLVCTNGTCTDALCQCRDAMSCGDSRLTCGSGKLLMTTKKCPVNALTGTQSCTSDYCCTPGCANYKCKAAGSALRPSAANVPCLGTCTDEICCVAAAPVPIPGPMMVACGSSGVTCPANTQLQALVQCALVAAAGAKKCDAKTCCAAVAAAMPPSTPGMRPAVVPALAAQQITCESSGVACPSGARMQASVPCTLQPDMIDAPKCNTTTCCTAANSGPASAGPGIVPIPGPLPVMCEASGVKCPAGYAIVATNLCTWDPDLVSAARCTVDYCCSATLAPLLPPL